MTNITEQSKAILLKIANEAVNWDGNPWTDLFIFSPQEKGNLSDLVKKGLIFEAAHDRNSFYFVFTPAGEKALAELGFEVTW